MSRINTNIPALVATGRLRQNQLDMTTRLERLATGLRINRGQDDPAGLIVSETLRKEYRSIEQAISNSARAINFISTAEGALNEASRLLLDLRTLIQSTANVGALSQDEMQANQQEIDAILSSIDRISNTTQFAGEKLLNGDLGYSVSAVDTNSLAAVQLFAVRLAENTARNVVVQVTNSAETAQLSFVGTTTSAVSIELRGNLGSEILSFASGASLSEIQTAVNNLAAVTGVSAILSGGGIRLNSTEYGSDVMVSVKPLDGNFIEANAGTTIEDHGVDAGVLVNGQTAQVKGLRVDARSNSMDARFYLTEAFGQSATSTTFSVTGGGSIYQIGPEVSINGQVHVGVPSISTGNLGNAVTGYLNSIRSGNTNEVAAGNFIAAENIVSAAIEQMATLRGRLGSVQKNQLETNINSQQIALENVRASESVIRDADIAVEVSALTRAQILVQSTQATLQIANSLPQSVLALLTG
ncbi:MAG TPA: flagellin [Phycisphaerae bacterium]|nr:flagellin [Phycisphaerae bacterium]